MTTVEPAQLVSQPKKPRMAEFDVVRALVLIGVFSMNYVVEWNLDNIRGVGWDGLDEPRWMLEVFDPWKGPLSTRFAATLTMLVGMGVAFGAAGVVRRGDPKEITEQRWRLRRRGVLFILIGVMFDPVWPGEILHYAGTFMIFAAWMITWPKRRLLIAAAGVMSLTAIQRVLVFRSIGPESASWWGGAPADGFGRVPVGTPRGYLSSVLSWGGHPVLPWLTFVIIGMLLAKVLVLDQPNGQASARLRVTLMGGAAAMVVFGYGLGFVGRGLLPQRWDWIASPQPGGFMRVTPFGLGMPAYVLSTTGIAVFAIVGLSWLARLFADWSPVRLLSHAGQMTFTIYLLHGLIPWALIAYVGVDQRHGLMQSFLIAIGSWLFAVVIAGPYHRWRNIGPMEWLLRRIGG